MKKIKLTSAAFILLLSASALVTGCKKNGEETTTPQEEVVALQLTSEADAEADVLFNEVFDNVMGVDGELGLGAGIGIFRTTEGNLQIGRTDSTPRCFTVTVTPLQPGAFPKTVVIDFGNGCTGRDGRVRKGKITTVYTGRMAVAGSKATTTFDNHFVDSFKVEGTHSIENVSTSNNRSFNVKLLNGKLSTPGGNYILHNKNKTWIQTDGNGTPQNPVDDVFSITGATDGTVGRGSFTLTWSTNILQPVIRKFTCRWPVQGQKEVKRNNRTAVFDFGNGSCDNKATFTINGTVHNITLR